MREAGALRGVVLGRLLGHHPVMRVDQRAPALGHLPLAHLGALGAERAGSELNVLAVVGLGLVPPQGTAEADARRMLRRIGRRVAVGGADQRQVVGGPGEEAQRVEAPRIGLYAGRVGPAEGALVGHDAVEGAGADHRARGLGAVADGHHAVGDRRRRARRGTGRRVPEVVRIVRLAGVAAGEFGGHGLAEHDGARVHELGHAGGVLADDMVAVDRRAAGGGHRSGRDDVFDGERNAVQRADRFGALVEHVGALPRSFGIERLPRMDLALAVLDAVEAGFDEIARLQPLLGHTQDGLAGRQFVGRFRHAHLPPEVLSEA